MQTLAPKSLTMVNESRGQLDRIVTPKCVTLGKFTGNPYQALGYGGLLVSLPSLVQGLDYTFMLSFGNALFTQQTSESCSGFRVRDHSGSDLRASFYGLFHNLALRLDDVDLDQSRSVEVEDQLRSSATISAAVLSPLTTGAYSYIEGFTPVERLSEQWYPR